MITSRHADELDASREEIEGAVPGANVMTRVSDMINRDDVDSLAQSAQAELGKIDILINNAGGNGSRTNRRGDR